MTDSTAHVVTWALVVIGWFFVDKRTNWRELRKENRAIIDKLVCQLTSLEDKAIKYHQASSHSPQESREIKIRLNRIISEISREKLVNKVDIYQCSRLRKAITLKNFDDVHGFTSQEDHSELLAGIYAEKDKLIDKIERKFASDFKKNKLIFF